MSLGVQSDTALADELWRRAQPWTEADYERVRDAALALVRTHVAWDRSDGTVRPSFDGAAYWRLLGALDRADPATTGNGKETRHDDG